MGNSSRIGDVFEANDALVLSALAGMMVPENGALPAASDPQIIKHALRLMAPHKDAVTSGLKALEEITQKNHDGSFASLSEAERFALVDLLKAQQPDFIQVFQASVVDAYYQDDRVLVGIGMEARPPHPDGYEVQPLDLSLLEPVRKRAPFYRVPK